MKIYGDIRSGNCLKVKYTADHLNIPYIWEPVDVLGQESHTKQFLRLNPAGQVPVIELEDGRCLSQSNAILQYLSEGSSLFSTDCFEKGLINQWLFWEQYSHEPYVAVCRFVMLYLRKPSEKRESWRVERGITALDHLESTLGTRSWLVAERLTIADISLLAYSRVAHEGGFDLDSLPNLRRWISRCESELDI